MKKVLLLDPSVASSNMGDFIIMECVREELRPLLENAFIYSIPTQLSSFNWMSVWRNSRTVRNYADADLKFVGGSNLMAKDMRTHYPQWNIHAWDCKPLCGVVLVGVGAGAGDYTNRYTTKLYQKVLHHEYCHSVRDERSREYVESLGLKAINTGCVTMWKLTPEFCRGIPRRKASRAVFTLTGRISGVDPMDQSLVDILRRNYDTLYYWIQGDRDANYFRRLDNTDGIQIIPPRLEAYDRLLQEDDLDYVGTRLHGGVYAMRHQKRTIIISIDERAREIDRSFHLISLERQEIPDRLEAMIQSEFATEIQMPLEEIRRWKAQFGI